MNKTTKQTKSQSKIGPTFTVKDENIDQELGEEIITEMLERRLLVNVTIENNVVDEGVMCDIVKVLNNLDKLQGLSLRSSQITDTIVETLADSINLK